MRGASIALFHLAPSIFHSGSGALTGMTFQKALCLICELPTADGAISAVYVDKEKLQEWFLNVSGHELLEEIEDDDLICYFCLWHAEFQWKFTEMADESLVWWNLDLDDAAKELRKSYFEGKLEQCWVQLEKIELPKSAEGEERRIDEVEIRPRRWKCIYCGKRYQYSRDLSGHMKKIHKEAIRCGNRNCANYFHNLEEREKHTKTVHESSRQREKAKCSFCGKKFEGQGNLKKHVRRVHKDFPVKCLLGRCFSYFKTQNEMKTHYEFAHKRENEAKRFQCNDCGYMARFKSGLKEHIISKHIPRSSECNICGNSFSSECLLRKHKRQSHTLKVCSLCKLSVSVGNFQTRHLKVKNCLRCKNKFQCSGLFQLHLKSCKKTLFKCDKCHKTFMNRYLLNYHTKREQITRGIHYKEFGFKCEPCKRYYKGEKILKQHLNRFHNKANLKYCAHCPKSFYDFSTLKHHLASKHNLIVGHLPCPDCNKTFVSLECRNNHQKNVHGKSKVRETCHICGKSMYSSSMREHLLLIHGDFSVRQ